MTAPNKTATARYPPGTTPPALPLGETTRGSCDGPGNGTKQMPWYRQIATVHIDETVYGTFRLNFHRFDRFELDLRGHTQP